MAVCCPYVCLTPNDSELITIFISKKIVATNLFRGHEINSRLMTK